MPFEDGMSFECAGEDEWIVTSCPAGRLECSDPSYRDACETIGNTMCNCRACGATCNFSCGETSCEEISEISAGVAHTCAIARPVASPTGAGTVACWGLNEYGQLGTGTIQNSLVPTAVQNLSGATSLATGEFHTCAVAQGRVYCWGLNNGGQLGNELSIESSTAPLSLSVPYDGATAINVASGSSHSCAIYDSGALACWGRGDSGQLGDDNSGEGHVSTPVRVIRRTDTGLEWVNDAAQVVGGYAHTCALSATGRVECWGDNSVGQIGQSTTAVAFASVPLAVPDLENLVVDEIAAAASFSCGRVGPDVLCWGDNSYLQLARSDLASSASPVSIPLPGDARAIAVGNSFGCALIANDSVHCWGSNDYGERGSSDPLPGASPNPVQLNNVLGIFGGAGSHLCAVLESGAWCWGLNDYGQLGKGSSSDGSGPIPQHVHALSGATMCPAP